jgi:tetratricopeptide (TPR) repeat protein
MRSRSIALLVLALSLAVPASASAQDAVITMKSGDVYQGSVISDDGKQVMFRTTAGLELGLPCADMSPESVYQVDLGRIALTDGKGQMKLGDEAAAAGLWANAKRHYHQAVEDDPSLESQFNSKMEALRNDTGNALLAEAKENLKTGDQAGAATHLSLLLTQVPQSTSAKEASQMLETLHAQMSQARQATQSATQSADIQQALAPAERAYQDSQRMVKEGLQAGTDQGRAIQQFQNAVQRATDGRSELKNVTSSGDTTPGLPQAVSQLDKELVAQICNADVQLASVYNQRGSYNDASGVINSGLALDPTNEELLSMRSQVASNSASSSWGYGPWVGRRGAVAAPYRR